MEPSVTNAADYKVSVLGAGAEIGEATVPEGQLGLYMGDPDAGTLLVVGTRGELQGFVELLRWHLLDVPIALLPDDSGVPCGQCPHVQAGHAGPDGMCLVSKPVPCACTRFKTAP